MIDKYCSNKARKSYKFSLIYSWIHQSLPNQTYRAKINCNELSNVENMLVYIQMSTMRRQCLFFLAFFTINWVNLIWFRQHLEWFKKYVPWTIQQTIFFSLLLVGDWIILNNVNFGCVQSIAEWIHPQFNAIRIINKWDQTEWNAVFYYGIS